MGTKTLDQALALLDRRYGIVAVQKGLMPRKAFKRLVRAHAAQRKAGGSSSVWALMRQEGFLSEGEMAAVLPAAVGEGLTAQAPPPAEAVAAPADNAEPAGGERDVAHTAETGVSLVVSEDAMKAVIRVKAGGVGDLAVAPLKDFLAEHEVTHGLMLDPEIQRFLEAATRGDELIVAAGTPPQQGLPDELECFFDTNPHRIGTLLEDGTMDWKDRGEIPQSAEGDLVAEIKPGKPGRPGVDVHGHVVAPSENQKLRVRAGKGASIDETGTKVFASRDGQPSLNPKNQITVLPVLRIKGDVGIETGHVEYEGHVEVPGTVQAGYRVRAESLTAGEIHSQDVEVAGDVMVRGGIYGARIKAAGNLKAHHVNRSALLVQGDIAIKKELVESDAQAGGRCLLDGGVILASQVTAAKGVACGDVGAETANDSSLQVGKDPWLKEAIADCRAKLKAHEAAREGLLERVEALEARADAVTTELGEIAQVQDKKMVAQRELQEQIKKEQRKPTAKEQVQIKTLGREVEKIDDQVAALMAEEERIDTETTAARKESQERWEVIEGLRMEIDELTAAAKANPSHTQIKITGRIMEHTEIRGFHARLTMKESVSRCVISEKLDTDPTTSRKWFMNISPL